MISWHFVYFIYTRMTESIWSNDITGWFYTNVNATHPNLIQLLVDQNWKLSLFSILLNQVSLLLITKIFFALVEGAIYEVICVNKIWYIRYKLKWYQVNIINHRKDLRLALVNNGYDFCAYLHLPSYREKQ